MHMPLLVPKLTFAVVDKVHIMIISMNTYATLHYDNHIHEIIL